MSDELAFTPALELAERVRGGDVTPVELTQLYLDRIERLDAQLNAYVTVDAAGALAAAARAVPGDAPFAGVPISIKDLNDVAGMRTTYSTKAFAGNVPRGRRGGRAAHPRRPASSSSARRTRRSSGRSR